MIKLKQDFFLKDDVLSISQALLGKVLCTQSKQGITKALITETEAYAGITDKASHAFGGRYTERTKIMYAKGGVAYVYLCYGIHYLFNVVTNIEGIPHAVLIRAIKPLEGIDLILTRRKRKVFSPKDFNGPGKVTQAMCISLEQNGIQLNSENLWIEDHGIKVPNEEIQIGPRVGIDYAGDDAQLPYRFIWKNH